MGIFFRRQGTEIDLRESWQPDGSGVLSGNAGSMQGIVAAAGQAYGAWFTLASAPGASITIWCHAIFAPEDVLDSYAVGMRCEYRLHGVLWVGVGVAGPERYRAVTDASEAARDVAGTLATTPRTGPSVDDLIFFDWDGVFV